MKRRVWGWVESAIFAAIVAGCAAIAAFIMGCATLPVATSARNYRACEYLHVDTAAYVDSLGKLRAGQHTVEECIHDIGPLNRAIPKHAE